MTNAWQQKIEAMSQGKLKLEVLLTKAVVPHRETIDAVANGILGGDLNTVAYFAGRDPAFALVAKVPIKTLADCKGVKIRSPQGLAAEVFKRAGASPVSLPFSEVYTSLEKGIVDAADASSYVNNDASGMHKVATYPLYPGIHSMAILQFIMNKSVWDKLTAGQRTMLETWYVAAYATMRREAELFVMNIQIYFLSPPFGPACFWLKSVCPPEITLQEIFRAVIPFTGLQISGLMLVLWIPEIALRLPQLLTR